MDDEDDKARRTETVEGEAGCLRFAILERPFSLQSVIPLSATRDRHVG